MYDNDHHKTICLVINFTTKNKISEHCTQHNLQQKISTEYLCGYMHTCVLLVLSSFLKRWNFNPRGRVWPWMFTCTFVYHSKQLYCKESNANKPSLRSTFPRVLCRRVWLNRATAREKDLQQWWRKRRECITFNTSPTTHATAVQYQTKRNTHTTHTKLTLELRVQRGQGIETRVAAVGLRCHARECSGRGTWRRRVERGHVLWEPCIPRGPRGTWSAPTHRSDHRGLLLAHHSSHAHLVHLSKKTLSILTSGCYQLWTC